MEFIIKRYIHIEVIFMFADNVTVLQISKILENIEILSISKERYIGMSYIPIRMQCVGADS